MIHDDDNDETNNEKPGQPTPPQSGYAKPPEAHQFKKGKSGNLRGRPKGAQGKRKIAEKVLLEVHEVIEDGRTVRRTTLELILIALRNEAFAGNNRAFKAFEKLDVVCDPRKPASPVGCLVVPGRLTRN